MFCPECNAIMEEIRTIPGPNPAEDTVIDLFECPRCHCIDEKHRTLTQVWPDDSPKV
jgi:hypothetical protein